MTVIIKDLKRPKLSLSNFGPIRGADVDFGDLTVIVGPQATGKSLFLQTLKLLIDRDHIHDTFEDHSMSFKADPSVFLDAYYGRGMSSVWTNKSQLSWGSKEVDLLDLARPSKSPERYEKLFYVPAQRVMSLPGGVSQNFGQFNFGDPYTLRAFSGAVHGLIQQEFATRGELFPAPNRLNSTLRQPIEDHLFGGNRLIIDDKDYTKRVALQVKGAKESLGFLSWSAGQREFTPMLLGIYWLCTVTPRRKSGETVSETIDWVVIEEPEMGLHPKAIEAVLLLVLELLRRGYRVVISTHSPVVLEMVWALTQFRRLRADESAVRGLFGMGAVPASKELAAAALKKSYKTYFFDRTNRAVDISSLDPFAESNSEAEWGGLSGFASRTNEAVAKAVNRAEFRKRR